MAHPSSGGSGAKGYNRAYFQSNLEIRKCCKLQVNGIHYVTVHAFWDILKFQYYTPVGRGN